MAKRYMFLSRPGLFTTDRYGGSSKVQKQFFDVNNGILAGIERKIGQG